MRSFPLATLAVSATIALSVVAAAPAQASSTPAKITDVSAVAGPEVGELTIKFDTTNANTTGYKIKTGLTSFSSSGSGRDAKTFSFDGKRTSITLTADQVAAAGAAPATGNHLYFRLSALNSSTARAWPHLEAGTPKPVPPKSEGTSLRIATFNVRTARATSDARNWLTRAIDVAKEIENEAPGIVALQELGPGRADGEKGALQGTMRQTESLERALSSIGASQYQLVRKTAYNAPGTVHGTQGARILYDTHRYSLVSNCPETTGKSNWNASCSFDLPIASGDSKGEARSAAYAEFADKNTGKHFIVVSAHLDDRHSGSSAKEAAYNRLRGKQAEKIDSVVSSVNTHDEQVIVAGDFNSWQNNQAGHAPHDYLIGRGYYDTAGAESTINFQYPTINHFKSVLPAGSHGLGTRIDMILVKGSEGAVSFENVVKPVDSARPSDHNMVVTQLVL